MTETKRLFYIDTYQKEFEATVLECRKAERGYEIILDQTAFYPEGGGQPADRGTLDGITVTDVREFGTEIIHTLAEPLEPGQTVLGVIDWEYRFDLMQQHSGEHMVSGIVHDRFGYDNVGFHMGADVLTIDFSGVLTAKELQEVEDVVNEEIWKDNAVEISYPSTEELPNIPYRSKKELTGQVRIVTYPGVDICACCGTHVARTGEIGMVRILSVVKFREGVRVEMICGKRVQKYLQTVDEQNHKVSVLTSAKTYETAQAVQRLQEEVYRLRGAIQRLQEESFAAEAERCKDKGDVLLWKEGLEADNVRRLCDAVLQTCKGRCAVFSDNGDGSYKYAIGQADGDLRTFVKTMNASLNGRGGGKPFFVQGSVKAERSEIEQFFEAHPSTQE